VPRLWILPCAGSVARNLSGARHGVPRIVTPAKAGGHPVDLWIPPFAGMTGEWSSSLIRSEALRHALKPLSLSLSLGFASRGLTAVSTSTCDLSSDHRTRPQASLCQRQKRKGWISLSSPSRFFVSVVANTTAGISLQHIDLGAHVTEFCCQVAYAQSFGVTRGRTFRVTLATCTLLVPPGSFVRSAFTILAQTVMTPPGASRVEGLTLQE